jgi:hypothetical protein
MLSAVFSPDDFLTAAAGTAVTKTTPAPIIAGFYVMNQSPFTVRLQDDGGKVIALVPPWFIVQGPIVQPSQNLFWIIGQAGDPQQGATGFYGGTSQVLYQLSTDPLPRSQVAIPASPNGSSPSFAPIEVTTPLGWALHAGQIVFVSPLPSPGQVLISVDLLVISTTTDNGYGFIEISGNLSGTGPGAIGPFLIQNGLGSLHLDLAIPASLLSGPGDTALSVDCFFFTSTVAFATTNAIVVMAPLYR